MANLLSLVACLFVLLSFNTFAVDTDGDGVDDGNDNCVLVANQNQDDLDNDGIGNICDADADGDNFNLGNDTDDLNPYLSIDPDNDGIDSSGAPHYSNAVCLKSPSCVQITTELSAAQVAILLAQSDLNNANDAAADAAQLVSVEQDNVDIAANNTAAALFFRDGALTDYQDASQTYTDANQADPNDPNLPTLLQDLVDEAVNFVAASSNYDTTLAAEAAPNAALLAAEAAETSALSNVGTATEALAVSQFNYNGLFAQSESCNSPIFDVYDDLKEARNILQVVQALTVTEQATLTNLEANVVTAINTNTTQQSRVDAAQTSVNTAEATTADAQQAIINLSPAADPQALIDATNVLTDAQTAEAEAELVLANEQVDLANTKLAISTADAAVLVQQVVLDIANTNLVVSQDIVTSLTENYLNEIESSGIACYVPVQDNCPIISNIDQSNLDEDSDGDACDIDIDGDNDINTIEIAYGTDPNDPSDGGEAEIRALEASLLEEVEVPAMGGIGLLALGLSILGLGAVRLKK